MRHSDTNLSTLDDKEMITVVGWRKSIGVLISWQCWCGMWTNECWLRKCRGSAVDGTSWFSTERGMPENWKSLADSVELTLSADDDDEDISSLLLVSHDVEGSSPEHLELLPADLSFNFPYDTRSNSLTWQRNSDNGDNGETMDQIKTKHLKNNCNYKYTKNGSGVQC